MNLTQLIRRRAAELGFDQIGFAPADPPDTAGFYVRWLSLGFAGEMEYLGRNLDERADLDRLVPGARSVVCLGMNYYQPSPEIQDPLRGRISCYARGDDYHELIKGRLFELWRFIQDRVDEKVEARVYVDTGPLLERELARRAGLGWQGKNTCLIGRRRGSFFFLAEIVLDLELEYDRPASSHCGTCTRCMDACPTQALVGPYRLDARRCISYLTIELKRAIPRDLRGKMGNWIFGCDVCQEVCPWNRKATTSRETAFRARPGMDAPFLVDLLAMDQEAFRAWSRRSPLRRAKRRGLLRNAAVALGNSGDRSAVPALIGALGDEEPLVRGHAAWALGRLGGAQARTALEERAKREEDTWVREEIRLAREETDSC